MDSGMGLQLELETLLILDYNYRLSTFTSRFSLIPRYRPGSNSRIIIRHAARACR